MTDYSWVDQPLTAPTECSVQFISNAYPLVSPLSQAIQVVSRPGDHLRMTYTWRNLYGGDRADVLAFFAQLNGPEHRALLPLFGHVQRGNFGGTPLVNGGSQTGNTLAIDGASTQTDWIKAGDWIEVADHFYMATADVDIPGGGSANIPVQPSIKQPSDNAPVATDVDIMLGSFILTTPVNMINDARSQQSGGGAIQNTLTLEFVEDVLA